MEPLILLPTLVCTVALCRWSPETAFLRVCLPVLLLFPMYFYWKIEGFPGVDFGIAVLMPLSVALLGLAFSRWRFSRSDLWITLYIVSCTYADYRYGGMSLAKYRFFDAVFTALVPYAAGKLLIEQSGERWNTVKTTVVLLALSCLGSIPEFFIKVNLFERVGLHLFPGQWPGWFTQLRWGFGRVAGPLGSAELYGTMLIIGICLVLYIQRRVATGYSFCLGGLSSKVTVRLVLGILLLTLYMTQSRGPWLGALVAVMIAQVGRAKRVKRAAFFTFAALFIIILPGYVALQHYASGPRTAYGSERETAQYRREMIENYLPLAKQGGLWGWGTFHPVLEGQVSIDNEFLRVCISQGYAGLGAFILLILESGFVLLRLGLSSRIDEDRHFAFTMLGILAGWVFTLNTVFMGGQNYELFFLMAGWVEAIGLSEFSARVSQSKNALRLQRVYT
jgi:hypothetical protein